MAKLVIIDMKKQKFGVTLKYLTEPTLDFKIEVELPKDIEKEASKDPLLQQEFKDVAKEIYEMAIKETAKKLKAFDAYFDGMMKEGDEKAVKKQVETVNSVIKNDCAMYKLAAEQAVEKTWQELKAKRKEWLKFKIKVGCSIAATLAGLAVSIAAMATSPWSGGAGAAFAILGFIKAGTSLAQDIGKLAIDIDGAKKIVVVQLDIVEKAAENPKLNALNEVTSEIFKQFLGISQPSLKNAVAAYDTLSAKYAKMVVNMHDLAKNLNKALLGQDKLKKEFLGQAAERLKKHPTPDKGGQLKKIQDQFDKEMEKLNDKVMELIGKVSAAYETAKGWAKDVADLGKRLKALVLKDPAGLKVFRELLKAATLVTSIFDGNDIASKMKDIGTGIITAGGLYVYDKIVSKSLDGTVFDAA